MTKLVLIMVLAVLAHSAYAANIKSSLGKISSAAARCSEHLTEEACISSACFFCESNQVAGFGGCFAEANMLPKSFYSCKGSKQAHQHEVVAAAGRKAPVNPSDPCEGKPDAKSCDALEECTWCKAAAVPSSCFTLAQSKFLPPAVFVCDKKPPSVSRR